MTPQRRPSWAPANPLGCHHGVSFVYICGKCNVEARLEELADAYLKALQELVERTERKAT